MDERDISNEQDQMMRRFQDVTGVIRQRAHFYLEDSDWEIDVRQMNLVKFIITTVVTLYF